MDTCMIIYVQKYNYRSIISWSHGAATWSNQLFSCSILFCSGSKSWSQTQALLVAQGSSESEHIKPLLNRKHGLFCWVACCFLAALHCYLRSCFPDKPFVPMLWVNLDKVPIVFNPSWSKHHPRIFRTYSFCIMFNHDLFFHTICSIYDQLPHIFTQVVVS